MRAGAYVEIELTAVPAARRPGTKVVLACTGRSRPHSPEALIRSICSPQRRQRALRGGDDVIWDQPTWG
jgi:hypothetical protein